MKTYLILAFLFFASILKLQGQHSFENFQKQEFEESVTTFSLSDDQQNELNRILERKFDQLVSIESLKTSAPKIYAQKKRSIFIGYTASFERMLNPEQNEILKSNRDKNRILIAQKIKEWKEDPNREEKIKDLRAGVKDY